MKKGTQLLMFDGHVKNVEDLVIGDQLMGDDSTPRIITQLHKQTGQLYKITPNESTEPYYVSNQHIMCLKYPIKPYLSKNEETRTIHHHSVSIDDTYDSSLSKVKKEYKTYSISKYGKDKTKQLSNDKLDEVKNQCKNLFPLHETNISDLSNYSNYKLILYRTGVEFQTLQDPEVDPYLLGLWLGDGHSNGPCFTNIDQEIIDYLYGIAKLMNLECHQVKNTISYRLMSPIRKVGSNSYLTFLRDNDLIKNKHIPFHYKINSRRYRLSLLAGLIDSDGYWASDSRYEITQKNKTLANDIVFLVRSLGFWCHVRECEKGCMYNGKMRTGKYQRISFGGYHLDDIPVLLSRKKAKQITHQKQQNPSHYQFAVDKDEIGDYYGFNIKGINYRFVMADFTVAHQSIFELPEINNNKQNIKEKDFTIVQKFIDNLFTLDGVILPENVFLWAPVLKKVYICNIDLYRFFEGKYGRCDASFNIFCQLLGNKKGMTKRPDKKDGTYIDKYYNDTTLIKMTDDNNTMTLTKLINDKFSKQKVVHQFPRYGYKKVNGVYVKNEKEQFFIAVVKQITEENEGINASQITHKMNKKYLNSNGNRFNISTIKSILKQIEND